MVASRTEDAVTTDALEALFDAVDEAALLVDDTGTIVRANPAAGLLFGAGPAVLVGQPLENLLPEGPRQWDPRGRKTHRCTARHQDGSTFPVRCRAALQGPKMYPQVLLIQPEDSEAPSEDRRLMRADLLAEAQAIAHVGSWESSFITSRLFWSDEAFRIFGYEPGSFEPTRERFRALVHPEDLDGVLAALDGTIQTNAPYRHEHRIVRPDGDVRVVLERGQLLRNEAGKPVGMLGTVLDVTDQRRAQAALRESEARLSLVTNAVPLQISYIGADLRYRFANAIYERWFRRPMSQIIGHTVRELATEETYPKILPHLQQALAGNRQEFELELTYPDGGRRIMHGVYVPDVGPDDQVHGLSTMLEDITEQRLAQEELADSRERLAAILNMAVDAIISVDSNYRILLFNRGAEEIFGYSAEEVLGRPLDILIPERYRRSHENHVRDFDRSGPPSRRMNERGDLYGLRRDGGEFPAEASISRMDVGGDRIFTVIVRDVSARKRAEAEMRASEERYRALVEGSVQGIIIHRGRKPLYVNPAMARIAGYDDPEDLLSVGDLAALLPPEELDRMRRSTMASELQRGGTLREQVTGIRKDGSTQRLEVTSQPVLWEQEPAFQTVVVDVTEREQLEAQLRQAQKMEAVGQLAGGVAHDFNNMLQVVRGYAELAAHRADHSERLQEYMDQILKATDGGVHLARQLLAFSRREVLQTRALELGELIHGVTDMLRRLIPEHVELALNLTETPLHVLADPSALEQVVINLCVNARDAMPEGGTLSIRTERVLADDEFRARKGWAHADAYALIEIRDTGAGIAPDVLPRIFEPFFTTKEPGKGTGLGLSMAYGTLQHHQGMIEAESTPGEGAAFRVYLPARLERRRKEDQAAQADVKGGQETILVAEDNPAVLQLVTELLQSQGYKVVSAVDGEDALARFATHQHQLDLVMLDLVMPKLSGRHVLERIRAIDPDVPVIFSTGYSATVVDSEFVQAHGPRMIQKPYHPAELFRLIRSTLEERAAVN